MTERDLQGGVIETARLLGYRVAHFRPARTQNGWATPVAADGKGYPDLTLCRPGRLVFAELKVGRNRATIDQTAWLQALEAAGAEAYLWTDLDYTAGTIDQLLR